jgi:prepilin peptidase CpaA
MSAPADWSAAVPLLALAALLALATWHDIRARRIPNAIVLAGTLTGLLLHSFWDAGPAIADVALAGKGPWFSLLGFALGLLLLMPFYFLRTMGAGDVKLAAMTGAFLGPAGVVGATMLTLLCGGVLALVVAGWHGKLHGVLCNVRDMLLAKLHRVPFSAQAHGAPAPAATGRLAYAIAITCGTAAHLMLAGSPAWRLFS